MQIKHHPLLSPSIGTQREIVSFHYGQAGVGEKVYLQASLHADELPGMLVLHHLKALLNDLEASGQLLGEVVVVPVANPIGLDQTVLHSQLGRFELATAENFNRHYPDFFSSLADSLEGQLTHDAQANKRIIRDAIGRHLASQSPTTELASLRHTLTSLAFDADVVLDLHCDFEAVLHIYTETPYLDQAMPLSQALGAEALLLAKGSGGASFDEAMSGHWWRLAERYANRFPIPLACLSATVELRGARDVYHPIAQQDAANLVTFLRHRGVVAGTAVALPIAKCQATPLAGSETLRAVGAGVVAFHKEVGDYIEAGEPVVDVIHPFTDSVTTIKAGVSGVLYARAFVRYATAGMDLCKIAGKVPFRSGYLLSA